MQIALASLGGAKYHGSMRTLREQVLEEIDAFLARTGIPETTLGKAALNDTSFVSRFRSGLDPRAGTIDTVRRFMAEYDQERPRMRADARAIA